MIFAGLALAACYFLFAGEFSVHELMAGFFAWALALSFTALVGRSAERHFECTRWTWMLRRLMLTIAAETWVVARVLGCAIWRRPAGALGTMHSEPFRHGDDEPADAGRRALVTLTRSMAPKDFVVDIPEQGDWLCVHSLSPALSIKDRE